MKEKPRQYRKKCSIVYKKACASHMSMGYVQKLEAHCYFAVQIKNNTGYFYACNKGGKFKDPFLRELR